MTKLKKISSISNVANLYNCDGEKLRIIFLPLINV